MIATVTAMSPTEVVSAFIAAVEAKDVDAAVALTDPDISYENMPIDPIVGRDGVRATLAMFLEPAVSVEWRVEASYEVGSTVINERVDRFEYPAGWLELPVAGVFHVADGLITVWRDYFDMATYQNRLVELTAS